MRQVIGFTKKYYTLWHVSDPYREYHNEHEYTLKQDCMYVQNLAMDLDRAKAKLTGDFDVDMELRGSKSFTRSIGDKVSEVPDELFAFGKYRFKQITECEDLDYLKWYYDETNNECAKQHLLANGYVEHNGDVMSESDCMEIKAREAERLHVEQLDKGYMYKSGERVEVEIKELSHNVYNGHYGFFHVVAYESKCGKMLHYTGGNPPSVPNDEFVTVKATIKHDMYNDMKQTKLQRIKTVKH